MKKLLLASVAVSGLAFAAAPAHAQLKVELGGYFKGYGAFVDQDEDTGVDVNSFDIVRDTELHVGGETTLGNGLTVGAQVELHVDSADADGTSGDVLADESYAYFSGNWGRVNVGTEDGAAYLLQVAAPSADSNYDGIRQYVQPFNAANFANLTLPAGLNLDYAQDTAQTTDKLTYLSPVFSGFQVGLSFAPDTDTSDDVEGVGIDSDTAGTIGETYEIAARYEGQFQQVGVIAGAGYSLGNEEGSSASTDDREAWNVGLDLNYGAFGLGAVYTEDNNARDDNDETTEVWAVGADYTTGPFVIGASYYNSDQEAGSTGTGAFNIDRYTGGVTYEYGPGMSFRGTISHIEVDSNTSSSDGSGTAVLLGTQVNF